MLKNAKKYRFWRKYYHFVVLLSSINCILFVIDRSSDFFDNVLYMARYSSAFFLKTGKNKLCRFFSCLNTSRPDSSGRLFFALFAVGCHRGTEKQINYSVFPYLCGKPHLAALKKLSKKY